MVGASLFPIRVQNWLPSLRARILPRANLWLRSQNLTSNINKATSQGIDTSAAKAERAEGEKAMQQGNEREALRHFQAGEQSLRLK